MSKLNLFQRLKNENKIKVEAIKVNYNETRYFMVMESLTEKHYYTELTVSECVSIFYYLDIDFTMSNLINLFDDK